jgi:hypothetical protein
MLARDNRPEPETLSEDMTRTDLIAALWDLRFAGGTALVEIDRQVCDYLINALRPHVARPGLSPRSGRHT